MNLDYLSLYQDISEKNIKEKTLLFLDLYEKEFVEEYKEKSKVLNTFSRQSAKLHLSHKMKALGNKKLLRDSATDLIEQISKMKLVEIRILVVLANNHETGDLELEEELEEIEKIQHQNIKTIELVTLNSGSFKSMISSIKEFKPHILHFSGHSTEQGIYMNSNSKDKSELILAKDFAKAIEIYGDDLYLIFLNSCKSNDTAGEIKKVRDDISIISYNDNIGIESAKQVSVLFYKKLARNPYVRNNIENTLKDALRTSKVAFKEIIEPFIEFNLGNIESHNQRKSLMNRKWNKVLFFFQEKYFRLQLFMKKIEVNKTKKIKQNSAQAQSTM